MTEMTIFEFLHDRYVLPKKVKLFEAFAGIGCQHMAFNRLGIEVELIGISEIDKYAIQSYNAIHGETKNWGSICDIKGQDLPEIDVFTWSFPCTDLSKAGKQSGLQGGTRSGLVYEVLRILNEATNKPKCLIMENVVDLVQTKFIREFNDIQRELESLGYKNYTETLNAKDYGVAQNRDRVFMVSILGDYYYEFPKPFKLTKRLKDYLEDKVSEKYYLTDRFIKGMLKEDTGLYDRKQRFEDAIETDIDNDVANTITTREGCVASSNYFIEPVCLNSKVDGKQPSLQDQVYDSEAIATAVTTGFMPSIQVKENTELGYAKAYEGDSINLAQPTSKTRRGRVGRQVSQTLTTTNQIAVVEPNVLTPKRTEYGKEIRKKYEDGSVDESRHNMTELFPREDGVSNALTTVLKDNLVAEPLICASRGRNPQNPKSRESGLETVQMIEVNDSGLSNTLTTVQKDNMVVEPSGLYTGTSEKFTRPPLEGMSRCLKAGTHDSATTDGLRIRKLTPRECWRLMGISDTDFDKASQACSNSQLYRQAGNGIVVDVFAEILKTMI